MSYGQDLINPLNQAIAELDRLLTELHAKDARGGFKENATVGGLAVGDVFTFGGASTVADTLAKRSRADWLRRHAEARAALVAVVNELSRGQMIDGTLVTKQNGALRAARNRTAELRGSM
jgi:hypothetical protein